MSYTIAIAGKGGTGKTTIAALLIRLISANKLGSVLGVDADPNNNLGEALGLKITKTIGSLLDEIAAHPDKVPAGMVKDRFIEYEVQTAIAEGEGFDLLTMGRPEGPGCYCYVNNILRNVVGKVIKDYDYVVIDNEAGLEHLSRRTTRSADTLLVVSDATSAGIRAAKRINELVEELKIKTGKRLILINRLSPEAAKMDFQITGLQYIGNMPEDEAIEKISLNSASLADLKDDAQSFSALRKLGEKIWI